MEKALWTIVTPTIGRKSILNLKQALRKESVPYVHLIMMDSKKDIEAVSPNQLEDERTFVYDIKHPLYADDDSRMDVYLRAIGIQMARTKYIRCCDDDVEPVPGHLSVVTEFMEQRNLDFTWCLRRMLKRSGEVIGIDNFEAIGKVNKFGYNLLDNSSLFYNQKAARVLSKVFLDNAVYGDDRLTWDPLHKNCKGEFLSEILTNHMAQPNLEDFFEKFCEKDF